MIPNLYIGNGCFTKHLFINGCLGFQVILGGGNSKIFYFHPYLGKWSKLTNTFQMACRDEDVDDVDDGTEIQQCH